MKLMKNKILFVIIGLSICIFILYLLSVYNKKNLEEGFITLTPLTYSETTITDYNNYIKKLLEDETTANAANNTNSVTMRISVDELQKIGVPEADVQTYIKTGLWPWSQGFINAIKQMLINTPNYDQTTITKSINDAQKNYPEQYYIYFYGKMYVAELNQSTKTKNLSCNIDATTKKARGDGMYTLDASGNITTTFVDNSQLPTLLPGFNFLNQPCNPCNILNGTYDCPYTIPNSTGQSLFPGFIMEYAWGQPSSTTTTSNSVDDLTSSISHLF